MNESINTIGVLCCYNGELIVVTEEDGDISLSISETDSDFKTSELHASLDLEQIEELIALLHKAILAALPKDL